MANEKQRKRTTSFSRRRPSSQYLDPLQIPAQDGQASGFSLAHEDDVIEEGKELFQNFVAEQIQKESPHILEEAEIKSPEQHLRNPDWRKAGRDLRMLADEFARTKERERVRDQAEEIQMDMTYEAFCLLLEELFHGEGITSERIVVLFYFCSDVAIRSYRTGVEMFKRFINWSLSFIADKVCSWVKDKGGWSQVLKAPFDSWKKVVFWGSLTLLVVGGIYWRGRLNKD